VNNAGTLGEQARIDEREADELTPRMQVNIVGPMVCAKYAVRAMSAARGGKGGSIVTVAPGSRGFAGRVVGETVRYLPESFRRGPPRIRLPRQIDRSVEEVHRNPLAQVWCAET